MRSEMDLEDPAGSNRLGVLLPWAAVLAALKLLGVIAWPWWVVTLPAWAPFALVLVVFAPTLIRA